MQGSKIVISAYEFAEALSQYIGTVHGHIFFPYRLAGSTFVPPIGLAFELADEPVDEPHLRPPETLPIPLEGGRFTLSTTDVCHAVSMYVVPYKLRRPYAGNVITRLPAYLPEQMTVALAYQPKGRTTERIPHAFDPL